MLGHKTSLSKFKIIKIISSTFSYHDDMKLEVNYKINWKNHKNMEIKLHATEQTMNH